MICFKCVGSKGVVLVDRSNNSNGPLLKHVQMNASLHGIPNRLQLWALWIWIDTWVRGNGLGGSWDARQTWDSNPLFCLQAWIPSNKLQVPAWYVSKFASFLTAVWGSYTFPLSYGVFRQIGVSGLGPQSALSGLSVRETLVHRWTGDQWQEPIVMVQLPISTWCPAAHLVNVGKSQATPHLPLFTTIIKSDRNLPEHPGKYCEATLVAACRSHAKQKLVGGAFSPARYWPILTYLVHRRGRWFMTTTNTRYDGCSSLKIDLNNVMMTVIADKDE